MSWYGCGILFVSFLNRYTVFLVHVCSSWFIVVYFDSFGTYLVSYSVLCNRQYLFYFCGSSFLMSSCCITKSKGPNVYMQLICVCLYTYHFFGFDIIYCDIKGYSIVFNS